jgi:hypothetical protein
VTEGHKYCPRWQYIGQPCSMILHLVGWQKFTDLSECYLYTLQVMSASTCKHQKTKCVWRYMYKNLKSHFKTTRLIPVECYLHGVISQPTVIPVKGTWCVNYGVFSSLYSSYVHANAASISLSWGQGRHHFRSERYALMVSETGENWTSSVTFKSPQIAEIM